LTEKQKADRHYAQWKKHVETALNQKSAVAKEQKKKKKPQKPSPWVFLQALLGLGVLLGLSVLLSVNRRRIKWKPVLGGFGLQAAFAILVLNPVVGRFFFTVVDRGVRKLLSFAEAGMAFVLNTVEPHLVTHTSGGGQWVVHDLMMGRVSPALKNMAFWVLPTIIFFSALMTLLYHLGVMQWIVRGVAKAMQYVLGTSGAETLSCSANVFVGQTEAPLLVKPFVEKMTKSELTAVMTGGFATVAGGVLAVYVAMLRDIPGIAGHLVTASLMAAPGALAVAKIVYPEDGTPVTAGTLKVEVDRPDANSIEAVARGASEGMTLVLNVVAMLIAFVAMVALLNALLGLLGRPLGIALSLEKLLGWILSPLAWCIGVEWKDAGQIGQLLGKKLVLTELLAYADLQKLQGAISARTSIIASYALCGFANLASIGIQIGGIGGIAPSRRSDLARLGLRAMFAGALVSCFSATWAGLIYSLNLSLS
jgi:CNT family concentrative nucleoside transporter